MPYAVVRDGKQAADAKSTACSDLVYDEVTMTDSQYADFFLYELTDEQRDAFLSRIRQDTEASKNGVTSLLDYSDAILEKAKSAASHAKYAYFVSLMNLAALAYITHEMGIEPPLSKLWNWWN